VDPVREGLLFERFLHGGMKALPDIDLDLGSRRRREVIRHLEETFGAREAMAAAYVTYRLPLALQDLGRVLGLPAPLRRRLTRHLGRDFRHLPPHRAGEAEPLLREVLGESPVKNLLLALLARMEKGQVRHLTPHVGGVVLAPGPPPPLRPPGPLLGGHPDDHPGQGRPGGLGPGQAGPPGPQDALHPGAGPGGGFPHGGGLPGPGPPAPGGGRLPASLAGGRPLGCSSWKAPPRPP
jgi:hypothetical protein